jgi:hypothetical protein
MQTTTISQYVGKNTSIESYCISIAFFRPTTLTNAVYVNDIPIEAGQTLTIAQNEGDYDTTKYNIVFGSTVGSTNELYIIKIIPKTVPEHQFS